MLQAAFLCMACAFLDACGAAPPTERTTESERTTMAVEALGKLQGIQLDQNPRIKEAVLKLLEKTRGTGSFLKLVQQFKLTNQNSGLVEVAVQNSTNETGVAAIRLLLAGKDFSLLRATLEGPDAAAAEKAAQVLGNAQEKDATGLLVPLLPRTNLALSLRTQAVRSLAQTSHGAEALLQMAKDGMVNEDLKPVAGHELGRARWPEINAAAATLLPVSPPPNAHPLPPVSELLKIKGDPVRGAMIFSNPAAACSSCHQVKGQGVDFGPNLTEVGTKLGKDALYDAILNPSAGISFGFETWQLELKSGDEAYGLLVSETPEELAIKAVGGIVTRYKKTEIKKREQLKLSIMPVGLQQAMTTQELVDLVEYLSTLRKGS